MMDVEGKSLRMITSFILGVGITLTLMVFYQTVDINSKELLEKISFGNGTGNVAPQELWQKDSFGNGTTVLNVTSQEQSPFQDLAPLLKRIAPNDKTIIMTSVNGAWAKPDSLLDLFLQSFRTGEKIDHFLKHLLIVAFDSQSFERCKLVHPYCYQLKVDENFTAPQGFMTKGYLDLVWGKVELQQYILEQGYNFLFTDVDIIWFRNPFKHITIFPDITTSSDDSNDPDDINNPPNTGFVYVKSSNRTIQMMKYWHDARKRFPHDHEQGVFNRIKRELINSLGVNMRFVNTKYFGGFCSFSTDLNKLCTVHANCCVNGLEAKLSDLRNLMDKWKNYTMLSIEEKNNGSFAWSKPGHCRM